MTAYATTQEVLDFLSWTKQIPNYPTSSDYETVDDTGIVTTAIYLDQKNIIESSYALYAGAISTTATELTETTHYTLDKDTGAIAITASGKTAIGTKNVYAAYKYNEFITESVLSGKIDDATTDIQRQTSDSMFGEYEWITREEHVGKGAFSRVYRVLQFPIFSVRTQLTADLAIAATAVYLDSTTGILDDDYLSLGSEIVKVVDVTTTTALEISRGSLGSTAATHSDDDWVTNAAIEISNSPIGSDPSWNFMEFRSDFNIDDDTGAVQLLHVRAEDKDDLATDVFPPHRVGNRFRITYKRGTSTVPNDIKRACILRVAHDLTLSGIARSIPEGRDGFDPTAQAELLNESNRLLKKHKVLRADGF